LPFWWEAGSISSGKIPIWTNQALSRDRRPCHWELPLEVSAPGFVGLRRLGLVLALSSGFMTYQEEVHPQYQAYRKDIATSPSTFVLLPSLHLETCVAETVRRQRRRPFSRSAEREEQVIRARFAAYRDLPAAKVWTMRPATDVVEELAWRVDRSGPAGFGHFASE
jgi:hypothetical protein